MIDVYKSFLQKRIKSIVALSVAILTFHSSFSQSYNWNNVAIGGGGFVTGIITSKTEQGVMFARTDVGGAYRWNATNSKWIPLMDWTSESETGLQGVESIAMDPQASKNVYILAGTDYFNSGKTAILRSTDYGNTFAMTDVTSQFKAHGNGMGRQNGEKLVVDPNKGSILFCGTRYNGLFKSTDSGANWSNVTTTGNSTGNGNGLSFVLIDPKSGTTGNASQTIFFGVSQTSNNFYKSTNGGTSFSLVTGGPALMPQRAVLASDNNMYITYADKEGPWNIGSGAIWKYNITTGAWTNVTPVLSGATPGFGGISVDPNNANRLIASTTNLYFTQFPNSYGDRFFLSTNGGISWTDLVGNSGITVNPNGCTWITGKSIHWAGCIEFNPFNTAQAYVISGNGVFVCDNVNASATTWKFLPQGLEETVALDIVSITGGPLVSVIGDYDGFVHSDITQYAPIHTPNMGTTTGLAVAATSTSKMVRVGGDDKGGKMYYTTNQGTSWTQTASINGWKGKVALSANGNIILHCPEGSSTMYRSTNNGGSWSTCNGVNITDAVPVADMVNSNKFYAYNRTSGAFLISTDGGANFSTASTLNSYGSTIARTVPGIEGDIWIPLYTGGLAHSTNSGSSFTTIPGVTACSAVGLGKAAPTASYHTIYIWGTVGGVTGVFGSIDKGVTWTRANDNNHEYGGPGNGQFVIGDMNVFGRVYMSTVGRGIAYGEISATCTATITTPSTSFCAGGSTVLTASTGVSYQWIKDLTPIANATNATYNAIAAGSYTVSVTNASGCTAIAAAKTVTVNALPTAAITSPSTSICPTGSVVLTSSTGTSYKWLKDAAVISTATNVTYSAIAAGSYTVEVTDVSGCKATSVATVITGTTQATPTITSPSTSICPTGSALLTSSTGTSYKWFKDAAAISTATNSTYSAIAAGSYTVEVTNASGCKATSVATVISGTIQATPTITSPSTSICPTGSALLTSSTGTSYKWFKDAAVISTASNSTYSAIAAGSYTVEVTNASGCKATSVATVITGTTQVTPTITSPSTSICPTGSALLTSSAGTSYKWFKDAAVISTATNSTYSAIAAGSYTVEVTNASGCKATSVATVITGTTQVTPTITSPSTSICPTGSALLTSSAGTSYKWFKDATVISTATNSTYSAIATGSYTIEVTNASGCKATSVATVITGTTQATPTITSSSTSICPTGSALLTSSTGTSYKWFKDATVISTATNSTYSAIAAGSYTVEVTNASGCKATSVATVITGTTQATPTITSPSTSFCTGGSLILSANASGTGLIYQWSNAAGIISNATNATYAAIAAGTYTVKVTNNNNCFATSAPTTITVTASQTATITSPGNSFCTGSSVLLSANTGTNLTYQWSNTAGTISGATNSTYSAITASTYTVTVSSGTCSAASSGKVITAAALPTANITTTATSFCTGGSILLSANTGSGLTYQWSNAAGIISNATNATFNAVAAGSYTVAVTNTVTTCSATSSATAIIVNALPTATITATATSFCTGGSALLSANTGSGLTYQWSNAAGIISNATNATYNAVAAGSYTVAVTNTNTCKAISSPITISVTSSITWYSDTDGDGKGDPNTTIISCTQPDDYVAVSGDACPIDPNKFNPGNCGCNASETSCLDCAGVPNGSAFIDNCSICVEGTTGNTACVPTATINGTTTHITVSPQPFQFNTTIKLENYGNIQSLTIINSSGALVEEKQNLNTTEIMVGETLSSGMYSVIIYTEQGVYTTKIVKY